MKERKRLRVTHPKTRTSSSVMETAGKVLKAHLEQRGLTIEDVSRKTGMRKAILKRLEIGDIYTKLGKLEDLCSFYKLRLNQL